jgi:hypothetical protein
MWSCAAAEIDAHKQMTSKHEIAILMFPPEFFKGSTKGRSQMQVA